MVGRKIYVEIGDSTVPVAIDENTSARDIKRQLGAEDYNLRVNDVMLSDNERILPLLREGSNTIRLLPPAIVGSKPFYFFEHEYRLAQEETLLRRRGFYRTGSGFTGPFVAGGKVYRMFVLIPETFHFQDQESSSMIPHSRNFTSASSRQTAWQRYTSMNTHGIPAGT